MLLSFSKTLNHNIQPQNKSNLNTEAIQKIVLDSIEKVGLNRDEVTVNSTGHLEIKQPNSLKLHTLTLEMEKHGLDLKFTKQTLIEIN